MPAILKLTNEQGDFLRDLLRSPAKRVMLRSELFKARAICRSAIIARNSMPGKARITPASASSKLFRYGRIHNLIRRSLTTGPA